MDIQFFIDIVEEHKLDVNEIYEFVENNYLDFYKTDMDTYIYQALFRVGQKFLYSEQYKDLFKDEDDEFDVYSSYRDSYIYFNSKKIQKEFERFS